MWQRILWFLIKHAFVPLFIYMAVTAYAISSGVDPIIANIIGGACGFGTIVVSFIIRIP
jgi:hypothetical protein